MNTNTQPNRWKQAFFVLAIVSACVIAHLILRLLADSFTNGMVSDGYTRRQTALAVLRKSIPEMLRAEHISQPELLAILQKHNQGAPIVSNASTIEMDLLRFSFAPDGSLDRIEQTDDYGFPADSTPTNRPTIPD